MAVTLTPLLVVDLAVGKVGQVGVKSALEVVVMMAVAAVETATVVAAAAVAAAAVADAEVAADLAFHVAARHSNNECGATQKPMSTLALVLVMAMVLAIVRSMPRTAIETTATAATTRWIAGVVCSPLLLLLLLGSPLVLLGMGVARGGEGWL